MASKLLIFILLLCIQTLPTFQIGYDPYYVPPESLSRDLLFIIPPGRNYHYINRIRVFIDLDPITKSLSDRGYNIISEIKENYFFIMGNSKKIRLLTKITISAPLNNNSTCSNSLIGHSYPGHLHNHVIRLWLDIDEFFSSSLVSLGSLLPVYIEAAVPFNIFINGFEGRCFDFLCTNDVPSWDRLASLNNVRIKGMNISTSQYNFMLGDWIIPEEQYWVVRLDIDSKYDIFGCYD